MDFLFYISFHYTPFNLDLELNLKINIYLNMRQSCVLREQEKMYVQHSNEGSYIEIRTVDFFF